MRQTFCWLVLLVGLTACAPPDSPAGPVGDVPGDAAVGPELGSSDGLGPAPGADAAGPGDTAAPDAPPDPPTWPEAPAPTNPLAAAGDALLPYPSDVFVVHDERLPGGRRVVLPDAVLPHTRAGVAVDFLAQHPTDGFPVAPAILALFPAGLDAQNLAFHTGDVATTLRPDSPTLILAADTGEPVLHFAELDPRASSDARRALVLRPLVRLRNNTRYIVALQGLRGQDGAPAPSPDAFIALRTGQAGTEPARAALAEHYERHVFSRLAAFGVAREALQLAWDFTTETATCAAGDMLDVRAAALAALGNEPPRVQLVSVHDNVDAFIGRKLELLVRAPLFLDQPGPGGRLARGAAGPRVVQNGHADFEASVLVPHSVLAQPPSAAPARVIQYGHGFFGNRSEAESDAVMRLAQESGFVVVAADWWGMSSADVDGLVAAIAAEPAAALTFTDRVHQAMVNFLALSEAVAGPLAELPELRAPAGELLYDPAQLYFYGISMGHILGGTFVALAPRVERAVLSVGGAPFDLMMFRARPFVYLLSAIIVTLPDALDQQKWAALAQSTLDRIDPLTYAPFLLHPPFADAPARRHVLMHVGIGDASVPNVASQLHARALGGLVHLQPAPRPVPFLAPAGAPWRGSALVEFDFAIPAPLPGEFAEVPSGDNLVHKAVRRTTGARRQIDAFLRPGGLIIHPCDGPCDPD